MTRLPLRIALVVIALQLCGAAISAATAITTSNDPVDYVVRTGSASEARAVAESIGVEPSVTFDQAVSGFAAPLRRAQVELLRVRPDVLAIEQDRRLTGLLEPRKLDLPAFPVPGPVDSPSWGLDRINQRSLPLDGRSGTTATGAGVTVFVLDTGVDTTHPEFGGRASSGINTIDDSTGDCDGHGTVVAGIAASRDHGVAPGATIKSVKVLDCEGTGSISSLLAGLDWVANHRTGPSVAVMSWSYGPSPALVAAVDKLVEAGVFVATSAGNSGENACAATPRSSPEVFVVANSASDDTRAASSSTGPCVDLYAPGSAIIAPVPGGGLRPYSGTSMAAPHAAGVAALYKQRFGDAPSATVSKWIVDHAVPGVVQGGSVGGTPNLLLNTGGL